jgi:hypothetical protein
LSNVFNNDCGRIQTAGRTIPVFRIDIKPQYRKKKNMNKNKKRLYHKTFNTRGNEHKQIIKLKFGLIYEKIK